MKNVYLIGIGGIGMSALARYYKHHGSIVAGYDRTPSSLTKELEQEGMDIHYDDDITQIPLVFKKEKEKTLVIYTPAIPADLMEYIYFKEMGYTIVKRSLALGVIAKEKRTLAVAGTHGKTTTSTILAHILESSGRGCNAFLGGISKNYHTNLLLSNSDLLVAEADEFDRSFLQLWPQTAVITSADADHLDIYNDFETIKRAFEDFASQVSGTLIVKKGAGIDAENVSKAKILYYSYDQVCDFYASEIKVQQGGYFRYTLNYPGGSISNCTVGIPGWVNVENAIAASAAAIIEGISPEKVKEALALFQGVERRFDIQINTPKCSYIDDYAHHPKEIAAAVSSIRNMFPDRKLTGIFQPHLYSRTRDFADEFAESLSKLDELILMDIYPARELPIKGVSSQIIFDNVTIKHKVLISKEDLMGELAKTEIDVLITFGAGDIDRFVKPIRDYLKQRYNV
ncbi:MAG: UDP-N-acetylmuramate--L-alanine ligase [Bacteroidetes bacterium HGW-Bacteroidetes-7]|jgi:UDP-N-acetylmuramate--alanine ligase|nr:MAG: UDP-N-acetylmuramate--L-alanine ligase [Bacteroidetes bacterium HGW-Bacteroidetes-7]